jgi:hypothetical protein
MLTLRLTLTLTWHRDKPEDIGYPPVEPVQEKKVSERGTSASQMNGILYRF